MELFTRQAAVALFFGLFATSTQAKEFSYLETFDDDATFSAGGALPDGWLGDASAVPVQRYEGAYLGSGNHSGSYVLGTMASSSMGRDSWVYTRKLTLKAGVAYTVSYWLHMPGGVAPAVYNNNVALYVGTDQTRETVLVSDVAGKTVATAKASAESTALSLSNVPAGLYIVKTDLGARKFVKK